MSIQEDVVSYITRIQLPGYGADEVGFMAQTMVESKPDFVADWGTNRGSSARIFWETARLMEIEIPIVTVDLPIELARLDRDHAGTDTGFFLRGHDVIQHRGDGVTIALQVALRVDIQKPLFFLDGDHSAENVYREITLINRVYPQAVLLCHDTANQEGQQIGPGRALAWWQARHPGSYRISQLASQAGMTKLCPL